jgi:hypothetical protein
MIFNFILWYPSSKAGELLELVKKMGPPPSYVKKWLTFQTGEGKKGIKHYNIVFTEKGHGDDAVVEITKMFKPFMDHDNVEAKLEVLLSARDALKVLS